MVFLLLYVFPFLLAVVLPAWIVPLVIKNKMVGKNKPFPSLLPFTLALSVLAIIANVIWENYIFNHIYFEWDRIFLPYTFFHHESPLVDGSSSWIAPGWQHWHLDLIWIAITIGIYILSALFWLLWKRKRRQEYYRFISLSVIGIFMTSIFFHFIFPFILGVLLTIVPLDRLAFWFRN